MSLPKIKLPKGIELVSVDTLNPYENNARTHDHEQVAQIAVSIAEFGFTNPILVDKKGVIVAGHGRLMAAKKLGLKKVPIIRLPHLSEAQRKAYVIADNKLALNAGWDEEMLAKEINELKALEFDLSLTGFSDDELKKISASFGDSDNDDAEGDGTAVQFKKNTYECPHCSKRFTLDQAKVVV